MAYNHKDSPHSSFWYGILRLLLGSCNLYLISVFNAPSADVVTWLIQTIVIRRRRHSCGLPISDDLVRLPCHLSSLPLVSLTGFPHLFKSFLFCWWALSRSLHLLFPIVLVQTCIGLQPQWPSPTKPTGRPRPSLRESSFSEPLTQVKSVLWPSS